MFYEREASSWRFQRPGLGPRFFRPARGGGGREVHSTCGSGVPRRFPAVARRRFYWPSPSGRPLNVDPRFVPTQGASALPPEHRQRGRFFGFGRDSGRAFHGQFTARDRNDQGRDREGISRPRYGTNLGNTPFLSSSRRPTWQTCFGSDHSTFSRRCLGGRSEKKDRRRIGIFEKTRAIIAKTRARRRRS